MRLAIVPPMAGEDRSWTTMSVTRVVSPWKVAWMVAAAKSGWASVVNHAAPSLMNRSARREQGRTCRLSTVRVLVWPGDDGKVGAARAR